MNSFSKSLEKIDLKLKEFINKYELSTERGPFSDELINILKDAMDTFVSSTNEAITTLDSHHKKCIDQFEKYVNDSKMNEKAVAGELRSNLTEITKQHKERITEINKAVIVLENSAVKEAALEDDDVYFYNKSSNQKELQLDNICTEVVKKYDYQISVANESYNKNIDAFNNSLEDEIKRITKEYHEHLDEFDVENENIIKMLYDKIEKLEQDLKVYEEKLQKAKNETKEKNRQDAISCNEKIKVLNDARNSKIDSAKESYQKALAKDNEEREAIKQKTLEESLEKQREYVKEMNDIDSLTNETKSEYNSQKDDIERNFFYEDLKLKQALENEIKDVINKDLTPKAYKKTIRNKNKLYMKKYQFHKKETDVSLKHAEIEYLRKIEKLRRRREILDVNREYLLKNTSDKDQGDNKYFQELSNIYEEQMNIEIEAANTLYFQSANKVKCASQISNKSFEKDYDIREAVLHKDMENIMNKMSNLKIEIDSSRALKNIIHDYEDEKYERTIKYYTVNTLLEIEKCKLLHQYNHRQYEDNVSIAKSNNSYDKNKISLEIKNREQKSKLLVEKINLNLKRDKHSSEYRIKLERLKEADEKSVSARANQYRLDSIGQNILRKRFSCELKEINQIINAYTIIIEEIELLLNNSIRSIFSNISFRAEYFDYIDIYVFSFSKIIMTYYKEVIQNLYEMISTIINERYLYEENNKFTSTFEAINNSYQKEKNDLLSKKENIEKAIKSYSDSIVDYQTKIYGFQNSSLVLRKRLKDDIDFQTKKTLIALDESNKKSIKSFQERITEVSESKTILNHDLKDTITDIKALDDKYNKTVSEYMDEKSNKVFSYQNLSHNLERFMEKVSLKIESQMNKFNNTKPSWDAYERELNIFAASFNANNKQIIAQLYTIVNEFVTDSKDALNNEKAILKEKYDEDITRINNVTYYKTMDNTREYDKIIDGLDFSLYKLNNQLIQANKSHENLLSLNDKKHNDEAEKTIEKMKKSREQFYIEFYAMSDNQKAIKDDYDSNMERLLLAFEKAKNELAIKSQLEKKKTKENLEKYIKSQDDLINHLPEATKFQSQMLVNATKELNIKLEVNNKAEKINHQLVMKSTQKNMLQIKASTDLLIAENIAELNKKLIKGKVTHQQQMRKYNKELAILK